MRLNRHCVRAQNDSYEGRLACLNEDEIFAMANIRPNRTGLPSQLQLGPPAWPTDQGGNKLRLQAQQRWWVQTSFIARQCIILGLSLEGIFKTEGMAGIEASEGGKLGMGRQDAAAGKKKMRGWG